MFDAGILAGFAPRFKSIRADCDRYSNELVELFEAGKIERAAYPELNGKGSLWVVLQYIEKGRLDDVEAHVRRHVTSRDLYGPLHQNTAATLAYLSERSEHDRVYSLFRAAIEHRLEALQGEAETRDQEERSRNARTASAKWIRHYLPAALDILQQYKTLLAKNGHVDPELLSFEQSLDAVTNP